MRGVRSYLLLASLGCVVGSSTRVFCQEAGPESAALAIDQKLMESAKKDSEIMKNLSHLSDHIGARLTGSASLRRANEWAAGVMESYGLANVHQEGWTIPVGWERGTATAKIVEPATGRSLILAAGGWTSGTKGKVVGDVVVIDAQKTADLAQYKGKLKNAIVLRGKPTTVQPITDLSSPKRGPGAPQKADDERLAKKADTKTPQKKVADAKAPAQGEDNKKSGPKGKMFGDFNPLDFQQRTAFRRELSDFLRVEGVACLFQDSGKPQGLLTMSGAWRGDDRVTAPEALPLAYVAHEHYELLYRLATRKAPAKTRLEIEINNTFVPGPITCLNTVGEIKGSEKPEQFVIVGAHIDSWDLASGTTDNGTGTCIVLETARILAQSKVIPKRTIRFVLFSGEEQGLHGSKAYVLQHKDELPRISMCLVHDTGTGKVQSIGLQGREVLKPIFEKELVSLKSVGVESMSMATLGGSDHASFDREGVPGFAVAQDMSEYRFTHHTQTDTLDKVHEANLIQGAQVMAVAAMRVANYPKLLPREKPERQRKGKGEKAKAEKKIAADAS